MLDLNASLSYTITIIFYIPNMVEKFQKKAVLNCINTNIQGRKSKRVNFRAILSH